MSVTDYVILFMLSPEEVDGSKQGKCLSVMLSRFTYQSVMAVL